MVRTVLALTLTEYFPLASQGKRVVVRDRDMCVFLTTKLGGKLTNQLPRDMSASTAAADPLKVTEATNVTTYTK